MRKTTEFLLYDWLKVEELMYARSVPRTFA